MVPSEILLQATAPACSPFAGAVWAESALVSRAGAMWGPSAMVQPLGCLSPLLEEMG